MNPTNQSLPFFFFFLFGTIDESLDVFSINGSFRNDLQRYDLCYSSLGTINMILDFMCIKQNHVIYVART